MKIFLFENESIKHSQNTGIPQGITTANQRNHKKHSNQYDDEMKILKREVKSEIMIFLRKLLAVS